MKNEEHRQKIVWYAVELLFLAKYIAAEPS